MRTTLEIRSEHRAALLEAAARRGEKGFSGVVAEAIETWLEVERRRDAARTKALDLRGSLPETEASRLAAHAASLRASWR